MARDQFHTDARIKWQLRILSSLCFRGQKTKKKYFCVLMNFYQYCNFSVWNNFISFFIHNIKCYACFWNAHMLEIKVHLTLLVEDKIYEMLPEFHAIIVFLTFVLTKLWFVIVLHNFEGYIRRPYIIIFLFYPVVIMISYKPLCPFTFTCVFF
jgi:hypothetical protein